MPSTLQTRPYPAGQSRLEQLFRHVPSMQDLIGPRQARTLASVSKTLNASADAHLPWRRRVAESLGVARWALPLGVETSDATGDATLALFYKDVYRGLGIISAGQHQSTARAPSTLPQKTAIFYAQVLLLRRFPGLQTLIVTRHQLRSGRPTVNEGNALVVFIGLAAGIVKMTHLQCFFLNKAIVAGIRWQKHNVCPKSFGASAWACSNNTDVFFVVGYSAAAAGITMLAIIATTQLIASCRSQTQGYARRIQHYHRTLNALDLQAHNIARRAQWTADKHRSSGADGNLEIMRIRPPRTAIRARALL